MQVTGNDKKKGSRKSRAQKRYHHGKLTGRDESPTGVLQFGVLGGTQTGALQKRRKKKG